MEVQPCSGIEGGANQKNPNLWRTAQSNEDKTTRFIFAAAVNGDWMKLIVAHDELVAAVAGRRSLIAHGEEQRHHATIVLKLAPRRQLVIA